ncbi:DNA repair protein rad-5 [Metarhizium album ARSEF 1941]|uniref:DNA repair protein rad-5 n=1 Tax=Metarhizium album (strain ARSEF 1941) TaxID=1081103 RepID=A0A0B2WY70_METAS|nr:DNA repair protein rad-5 [Metarhizium album ARSEF 1941]KHO01217.1 DNA repair protein rad-5 [Metarhizium album ARSEF 1941]
MELGASQEPPSKKRRFFRDPGEISSDPIVLSPGRGISPVPLKEPVNDHDDVKSKSDTRPALTEPWQSGAGQIKSEPAGPTLAHPDESTALSFDKDLFESVLGDKVSNEVLNIIRDTCGNNLERAVNMFFDGTYKKFQTQQQPLCGSVCQLSPNSRIAQSAIVNESSATISSLSRGTLPRKRYLGAFGVEGWATRSGSNILRHGDVVKIERQKIQPPPPPKIKNKLGVVSSPSPKPNTAASRRVDVIVRFTNQSGTEIGRLAKDTASWVSTLIDQNVCHFEGNCVYAPERLRTNDTVYLQLRCSLLHSAFDHRSFKLADHRPSNFFEQSETADEKELRLRQIALVRLFQEINLQPTRSNSAAKDGRKGILQAAEMDEQKQRQATKAAVSGKESESVPNSSDTEEGEELEQDQLDALYKKAQSFDFNTPEAEPADSFAMTLRPYQKQSLHWMVAKEKDERSNREPSMHPLWEEYDWPIKDVDDNHLPEVIGMSKFYANPYSGDLSLDFPVQEQHCLGGILADEMGLGKTIQMLSLIHSHRSETARQARLTNGSISSVNQLARLGVNSSSILPAPCTTLVVAPMSLLAQWKSEAEKASKEGTMKIELYYGNEKTANLQASCSETNASQAPDLVITSYGVVLSEFSSLAAKNGEKSFHSGLFSLKFFRVILDEAHHIKNRSSKTARACYEISADHRWVLTGTPIVNKLEDLFSLVRFLGVEPWNNFSFWKTFITVPFEAGDFMRALDVVQTVLEPLVMRRTKDMETPDGQPLVPLPPKQVDIVDVELSKPERDVYDYIFHKAKRTFSKNVEAGTVMKAFTTIFAQILRLRQSCCHPILVRNRDIVADELEAGAAADAATGLADDMDLETLVAHFTAVTDEAARDNFTYGANALEEIRNEADKECPLCFDEPMNDQTVTGCWHSACRKCLLDFMKHESDRGVVPRCFNCREPLNQRDLFEVVRHDDDQVNGVPKPRISLQRLGVNQSSAKVAALISELRALRREHPQMKSVVFSQFTSFLSLIEPALARASIRFLRLDGSMAQKARAAVLEAFTERTGFMVLLISLRAGGVGLNLTSAGRVFMMDPWWSFAVEAQAIDRVHRLGQEDEVVVKRFIVKESVEERMLRIQDRKKFM